MVYHLLFLDLGSRIRSFAGYYPAFFMNVKNRRPYNLYCVGGDVKPSSINS